MNPRNHRNNKNSECYVTHKRSSIVKILTQVGSRVTTETRFVTEGNESKNLRNLTGNGGTAAQVGNSVLVPLENQAPS